MLKALKAWLQRRRESRDRMGVESLFSKHVSRKVLDAAAKQGEAFLTGAKMPRKPRSVDFAFISVTAPEGETYSNHCAILTDLAHLHGGSTQVFLPVVVIGFGCVIDDATPGACLRFVKEAHDRLPAAVSIVHGSAVGELGSYGSSERLVYGFWWSGMLDALRLLAALKPGEVRQIDRT